MSLEKKTLFDYVSSKNKETSQDKKYLSLPLIKPFSIELREYQERIIESIDSKNTLVVLPTGLGKTIIAVVLVAKRLVSVPNSKALILAPTRPLVQQHMKSFENFLDLPKEDFVLVTGNTPKNKRKDLWFKGRVFFSTPQTVKNDIEEGILNLDDFSIIVFDEAHRAVGDYAYVVIAKKYVEQAKHPLILGLTASPGGEIEKIGSVIANLYIENVEVRSYYDEDVKKYIKPIDIEWMMVSLPETFRKVDSYLKKAYEERINKLFDMHIINSKKISKKELIELQRKYAVKIKEDKSPASYTIMSYIGQALKISYAIELVETQGLKQFVDYVKKLIKEKSKSKSLESLLDDENFITAYKLAEKFVNEPHPKLNKLREIVEKYIKQGKKAIVFTQYVDTAKIIVDYLKDLDAVLFIGQRKGYSQKKQLEIIEDFRNNKYKVLVATSVAEEGLDIPLVDLVVFYEPIPSEIRSIQRRGRTGRFSEGKVVILLTKDSLDEVYYWASISKERNMRKTLLMLKKMFSKSNQKVVSVKNKTLPTYSSSSFNLPVIYVDHREEKLYEYLKRLIDPKKVTIKKVTLDVGDVVIGDKIAIERKTSDDFIASIVDGRLFSQLDKLITSYEIPLIIIEGSLDEALEKRNIHQHAVMGALSKIAIEYHVPVLWSKDLGDTARYVLLIAKRLSEANSSEIYKRIKKPTSLKELQESVVSSFPSVSKTLSQRILSKFKTLKDFANATPEMLMDVEGIGEKKAKKIYEVLNANYQED